MEPFSTPRIELRLIRLYEFYDHAAYQRLPHIAWYGQSEIVGITVFEASADLYRIALADGTTHIIGGRKWIYILIWHTVQR